MADVRCPMCGKSNPAEMEVCQFCRARLKPLRLPQEPDQSYSSDSSPAGRFSADPDAELPDWLRSLRKDQEPEEEPEEEEDFTEWLQDEDESRPETSASSEENEPGEETELPYWLNHLRERSQEAEQPAEDEGPVDASDQVEPDSGWWPANSSDSETGADWLASIRSEAELPDEETKQPEPDPSPDEQPEWLSRIRSRRVMDEAEATETVAQDEPGEEEVGTEADPPSWLSGLERTDQEQPQENTPDWFAPGDLEPMSWSSNPSQEADLPGDSPEEDVPDWLAALGQEQEAVSQSTDPLDWIQKEDAETTPVETPAEELPDWMADISGEAAFAQGLAEEENAVPPAEEKFVPPFDVDAESQNEMAPLEDEKGLPEWLANVSPKDQEAKDQNSSAPGPFSSESDDSLTPAELPSWLEAMRPVASVETYTPSDEKDDQVEGAGPLTGLSGVLPAEPDVTQVQKPQPHTVKLQVTEANQANAALIQQMIKIEGMEQPIPRPSVISSQYVLRILFAVILFISILWPLITASPQVDLPEFTSETGAANSLVEGLASGAPVLLAIDYEPGLSGEMDAATSVVIDHLMLKGAYLAMVSTSPTGPVLAERLITNVNQQAGHHYQPSSQYVNLGYIPGGSAGLLGFAQTPRQILPYALDGSSGWGNGPLQNIRSLAGFALVIVVSDNPDNARAWIEQVGPSLASTPLLMVASAQAEPLLRPYYEAIPQQVQGLVTGLAGGAAYENLNGRSGPAGASWGAFSFSLLVTSALILIGGAFYAASSLLSGLKKGSAGREGAP